MMKKIVYILCFLLCFSCSQYSPKSENAVATEAEEVRVDKDGLADNNTDTKFKVGLSNFSLDEINSEIEEKLQANYEAIVLAKKHPEFKEAIKEQLAGSDKFHFTLSDSIQSIEIKELTYVGSMESRNDSVSAQKILYTTLINSKYTQQDSVLVIVKRKLIEIDNTPKMNTSIVFEKLD